MKKIIPIVTSVFTIFVFSANAQIGASLNSNTSTDLINTSVETTIDSNIDHKNNSFDATASNTSTGGTSSGSTSNQTSDGKTLIVNSFGVGIASSDQVKSNEDLEVFNWNQSIKNKSVDEVVISPNDSDQTKIEVHYYNKGKLLGIIPVRLKSTTVVEASPNSSEVIVDSKLPWWSFLVKTENYNEAGLEASIKNSIRTEPTATLNVNAKERAEIAETIIAKLDAQAKVSQ